MVTVVRIGRLDREDLDVSIERTSAHWWYEVVNGASILEIDEGVVSVGSNRFVGQDSDEPMVNMDVIGAMIKSE